MGKTDAANAALLAQRFDDERIRHLPGKIEDVGGLDGFDKFVRRAITSAALHHAKERSGAQLGGGRKESIDNIGLDAEIANKTDAFSLG